MATVNSTSQIEFDKEVFRRKQAVLRALWLAGYTVKVAWIGERECWRVIVPRSAA